MVPPLMLTERFEGSGDQTSLITPLIRRGDDVEHIHLLHVDDNRELVEMCADFIESIDGSIDVSTETSAVAGLERLEVESFDCIISDYEMPEMDGLAFLDVVRDRYSALPFILYTGKGSEEVASDAITRGVTDYLQKESGTEQYKVLVNRVRNAVDQYHTERELLNALRWYQRLVEQSVAGIYLTQDERFVYVNEKFASILGYEQLELIGESIFEIVDTGDQDLVSENIRRRERGDVETIRYEWTAVTKSGEQILVEAQGGTIEHDGQPAILGLLLETAR